MCKVLDRIENRGIEKGISQGIEKGIAQGIEKGIAQGIEKGITQGIEKGIAQGITQGITQGIAQGEDNAFSLVKFLMVNNRLEDLKRVSEDEVYRNKLMEELRG